MTPGVVIGKRAKSTEPFAAALPGHWRRCAGCACRVWVADADVIPGCMFACYPCVIEVDPGLRVEPPTESQRQALRELGLTDADIDMVVAEVTSMPLSELDLTQ